MASVKTPKFFLVDGRASEELKQAIKASTVAVPSSYKEFVLRFGNARLYRQGNVYLVRVFAAPRESQSKAGEALLHFARTDLSLAYFKRSLLVPGGESPVFVWRHGQGLRKEADRFEDWLRKSCKAARNRFKKTAWQAVLRGPDPFSEREKEIVEARKGFSWRLLGVTDEGDLSFEVYNGSGIVLPYLSIGVREKGQEPVGVIWLPVANVGPGQTQVIHKSCYKDRFLPQDIEPFEQPDPGPEDRAGYWEFKALAESDG
jgi:hypothetical protein